MHVWIEVVQRTLDTLNETYAWVDGKEVVQRTLDTLNETYACMETEVVQRTLDTLNETYACMERSCSTNTWYFTWNICMYGKKLLNDHLILYVKHTHVWKEVVQRTLVTLNETYICMESSCWTNTCYFKRNICMYGKKLFKEHLIP